MTDAYLNIAEEVLNESRRPMRPRDIIAQAVLAGLLPEHLYGPRQDKTLHARLSEDVSADPERSRFFRTAPGVFFIHSLTKDARIPDSYKVAYFAKPRKKELSRYPILIVDANEITDTRLDGRTLSIGRLRDSLSAGSYRFKSLSKKIIDDDGIPVHSFVVVTKGLEVLSFRCGKFFPVTDPLYGKRSIGIGGAVLASDSDMTYDSMWGIIGNGVNELRYGIGLPNRLAEKARYENELRPFLAVILREGRKEKHVLHVVLSYKCPEDFAPTKAALSINDLRWVNAINPGNSIDDYDFTSQFLFTQDYVRDLIRSNLEEK